MPATATPAAPAPATGPTALSQVQDAERAHRRRHAHTGCVALDLGGGYTLTLFGDGTTGARLTKVRLGLRQATAYVELDDADTIARVTALDTGTGRTLPPYQQKLAGHAALRAALRARRLLRAITAGHARPRRLAP